MSDLQDELDAYVLGDDEFDAAGDETVEPPPDAEHANRLLRAVRALDRQADEIERVSRDEIERISAWRDDRLAGLLRRRSSIERALDAYMRALNRLNPKRKTEKFPNGTLRLRAPRTSVDVYDTAAFSKWWRERVRFEVGEFIVEHLSDPGAHNVEALTAEVVELVLSRSPVVSVDVKPSRTGLAQLTAGPKIDAAAHDDADVHALVLDGEAVPGVALVKPTVDSFSVTA